MYNRYYLGYIPHKIYDLLYTVSKESDANFIGAKYQYLGLKNKLTNDSGFECEYKASSERAQSNCDRIIYKKAT